MNFKQTLNLAVKNIFRAKLKSITSMLIIATGIITLLLTQGINQGTREAYQKNFLETNSLKEIKVLANMNSSEGLTVKDKEKLSSINHVQDSYFPFMELTELLNSNGQQIDKLWINSMPKSITPKLLEGKNFKEANEVLLPKKIEGKSTEKYVGKKLKINHMVADKGKTIVKTTEIKVSGIYDEARLNVPKGTALANPQFVYSLRAEKTGANVKDMLKFEDLQSISLIADSTESVPKIAEKVEKKGYNTEYSLKEVQEMPGLLGVIPLIGTVISVIILLIGAINIGFVTIQNVRSRYSEIGLLKALGFNNKLVIKVFLLETLIIAITSYLVAILIFFVSESVLNHLIITRLNGQFSIISDVKALLGALIISLSAAIIGSIIPTIKASKINPSIALKE